MKKFTKTQWKNLRVIRKPDERGAMIKADDDGNMWQWHRANGHHVWANHFIQFPWRSDMDRILNTMK